MFTFFLTATDSATNGERTYHCCAEKASEARTYLRTAARSWGETPLRFGMAYPTLDARLAPVS